MTARKRQIGQLAVTLSRYAKDALVLGLFAAIGPFAIDMYLPALPNIAASLETSTASTQMTLTSFFLAFGLCQIFYGPISDMIGRKPPAFLGLALFVLGSIGCSAAHDVSSLIGFRFVQGAGAACTMAIPRAIIRDLHTGLEATRLMSTLMLVISVSPILAPLIGSALIVPFGWRAVFIAVTATAFVTCVLLYFFLPETRPPEERLPVSLIGMFKGFALLFRDWRFLGLTFIGGFGMGSFFVFLASSSFVYIGHFGLTPTQYSLCFAVNAVGFIGASQFAAKLGENFGMARVVMGAVALYVAFALILLAVTAVGVDSLAVLMVLLFCTFACLGLVVPPTMVLALEHHGPLAGLASALGGTLQMAAGGAMIALTSVFFNGTVLPMVAMIALCAICAFLLAAATLGWREVAAQAAE
jgi:DHA1 family bicyclomycin/chloramphenicol resistance-like MFS transporter